MRRRRAGHQPARPLRDSGTLSGTSSGPAQRASPGGRHERGTEGRRPARRARHSRRSRRRLPGHRAHGQPQHPPPYTSAVDRVIDRLGRERPLAEVADAEIGTALAELWGASAPATWNRNRAAIASWLTWCHAKKHWAAPSVPADAERRKETADETRAVAKITIQRLLSRRDLPLRGKTLWRMLYETAAGAAEILALNVEDLDLEHRRAPVRSKGGAVEWVYWGSGTAHLLPRLLRLPDGSTRTRGPLFLSERRPVPARRPAATDICPHTGRAPRLRPRPHPAR
ncbi:hypothetical protein ACQEVF_46500 [Nonomuraea polychroma]|uniref:hypothetical protein n=1 Tax=Nonomuraea polychroma TaxID=46176 RepID=UPI003D925394